MRTMKPLMTIAVSLVLSLNLALQTSQAQTFG